MVTATKPDSFYTRAFCNAWSRVDFQAKDIFRFEIDHEENFFNVKVLIHVPDYDKPYRESQDLYLFANKTYRLEFAKIPADHRSAEEYFIRMIFRAYMEMATHELMEGFAVDNKRFINPHENGKYGGYRIGQNVLGNVGSWRNHVMWEACALIARSTPPDFRSFLDRTLDEIVDFDLAIERGLKLRLHYFLNHFYSWMAIAKWKFKEGNFWNAAGYSLAMVRMMIGSLISGEF